MNIYKLFKILSNDKKFDDEHIQTLLNNDFGIVIHYFLLRKSKKKTSIYALLENFNDLDKSLIICLYKEHYNITTKLSLLVNCELDIYKYPYTPTDYKIITSQTAIFFLGLAVLEKYSLVNYFYKINASATTDIFSDKYIRMQNEYLPELAKLKADYAKVINLITDYGKYLDNFFDNKFDLLMISLVNKKKTSLMSLYLLFIFTDSKIRHIEKNIVPVIKPIEIPYGDILI